MIVSRDQDKLYIATKLINNILSIGYHFSGISWFLQLNKIKLPTKFKTFASSLSIMLTVIPWPTTFVLLLEGQGFSGPIWTDKTKTSLTWR
jgi:hypothetical protein